MVLVSTEGWEGELSGDFVSRRVALFWVKLIVGYGLEGDNHSNAEDFLDLGAA
jgi:hypothetical protein